MFGFGQADFTLHGEAVTDKVATTVKNFASDGRNENRVAFVPLVVRVRIEHSQRTYDGW